MQRAGVLREEGPGGGAAGLHGPGHASEKILKALFSAYHCHVARGALPRPPSNLHSALSAATARNKHRNPHACFGLVNRTTDIGILQDGQPSDMLCSKNSSVSCCRRTSGARCAAILPRWMLKRRACLAAPARVRWQRQCDVMAIHRVIRAAAHDDGPDIDRTLCRTDAETVRLFGSALNTHLFG